jgi:NADPH-dependent 2,4-dienoyl-CoA reductase/sulfur reductase-like enzyme
MAILGIGVQPNTGLAKDAGLALGVSESSKVDNHMRTNAEGV